MRQFGCVRYLAARSGILVTTAAALMVPAISGAQTDIVLSGASAPTRAGHWTVVGDSGASIGAVISHPDGNAAKILTALESPSDYFELTFDAEANRPYRLWVRGRAEGDYWGNDSVFVQFSNSVNDHGQAIYRIGTTSAATINLEECNGCGVSGWTWQDNGYGAGTLGPVIYFDSSGTQRLRVQTREDGLSVDQILLSPVVYRYSPPTSVLTASGSAPVITSPPPAPTSPAPSDSNVSLGDILLHAGSAPTRSGQWTIVADATAVDGVAIRHPDGGAGKLTGPLASPSDYFELTFDAVAGRPYRLWIRGRADNDYWGNDSVFVQFTNSIDDSEVPMYRIGTASAATINLEECSSCGLSGWTWQDNGHGSGVLGPVIYFGSSGTQRLRVQTREDGLSIDQILLSPIVYRYSPPPPVVTVSAPPPDISSPAAPPAPAPEFAAGPPPESGPTGTLLKVLTWNTHHGFSNYGVYNLDRISAWIVQSGANVVSLNEVERYNGWGDEDQPERYAAILRSMTGRTWYYNFAQRDGLANGQGNLILSTFPIEDQQDYLMDYSRSAARAQIVVNGVRVNLFSTHLDSDSADRRAAQMNQLKYWASSVSQQWIAAGDFNAWPGAWEINTMTSSFHDSWATAAQNGTAVAYSGNEAGNTRKSRIDYVFYSHSASRLVLRETRVFDTRDADGSMPSDHRPVMATFEIQ